MTSGFARRQAPWSRLCRTELHERGESVGDLAELQGAAS